MMIQVQDSDFNYIDIPASRIVSVAGDVVHYEGRDGIERGTIGDESRDLLRRADHPVIPMVRVDTEEGITLEIPTASITHMMGIDCGYVAYWEANGEQHEGLITFDQADAAGFAFTSDGLGGYRRAIREGGGSADDIRAALDCAFARDGASNAA